MLRFVLLEHEWNGVHWDLMLEVGDSLRTWALERPIEVGIPQPARALPPHRLAYLDYEGKISNDRGEVRRLDRGNYEALAWEYRRIVVRLDAAQVNGVVELDLAEAGLTEGVDWRFLFLGKVDLRTCRLGNERPTTGPPERSDRPLM